MGSPATAAAAAGAAAGAAAAGGGHGCLQARIRRLHVGTHFDLKAVTRDESGSVEIIGGSGKWADATGEGSVKRKYSAENRGSYEYEFNITTP